MPYQKESSKRYWEGKRLTIPGIRKKGRQGKKTDWNRLGNPCTAKGKKSLDGPGVEPPPFFFELIG